MSKYCIGDIHGCYFALQKLIDYVVKEDKNAEFVFLGDYIDRGRHSRQVIHLLLELKNSYKCNFLLGNHDDVFRYFLGQDTVTNLGNYIYGSVDYHSIYRWMQKHGLDVTLNSFGCEELEDILNIDNEYKEFFKNLEIGYIDDNFFAFHGFYPNQTLPRDIRFIKSSIKEELIWGRFDNILLNHSKYTSKWDRIGVFGHTPTYYATSEHNPIVLDKIAIIDTGSYMPGKLTAFNPVTKESISVDVCKDDLQW
jgi:serine/threonine protein phosphatase 1